MQNIREIRSRIKGVKSTQQITKAMNMVSVSKLRRTQSKMEAMQLFAEKSRQVMLELAGSGMELEHPLLAHRAQVNHVTYVLVVGTRGLCGAYNTNVVRFLTDRLVHEQRPYEVIVIGRWSSEQLAALPVSEMFTQFSDIPTPQQSDEIVDYLTQKYLDGETDEIHLIYQRFVNVLKQEPVSVQLLPAVLQSQEQVEHTEYQFEPNQAEILNQTVQLYLSSTVYNMLLQAKSGEHSARMTAMSAAADNTEELIETLSLALNRARQAQITTEISEISGGAAALEHKKQ